MPVQRGSVYDTRHRATGLHGVSSPVCSVYIVHRAIEKGGGSGLRGRKLLPRDVVHIQLDALIFLPARSPPSMKRAIPK